MENTSRKRDRIPSIEPTNEPGRAPPKTGGSALQIQGLPPLDRTPQTSLSEREVTVAVSNSVSVVPLALRCRRA
jgi:hypothetical protein